MEPAKSISTHVNIVYVHRPRAIVFDILGTASKSGFLEKILFPFLKANLDTYINTHWTRRDFIKLYGRIVEQSIEFNKQEPATPVVLPHESPNAHGSLLAFITFVTDNGVNSSAVTQLRFKVWFEGYQQHKLRTPIYSDVSMQMRKWFAEGIKFYVFSNTWAEAQKALLRNTNHGDLTNLISDHFDNDFGSLTETDVWRRFCTKIRENPSDVLFLTKSSLEGRAAAEAGLNVVLVLTHRHNVKAVSKEDRQRFPYVRTLNDLGWTEGAMTPATPEGGQQPAISGSPLVDGPIATAMSVNTNASPAQASSSAVMPTATGSSAAAMTRSQTHQPSSVNTKGRSHSTTATAIGGSSTNMTSKNSTRK